MTLHHYRRDSITSHSDGSNSSISSGHITSLDAEGFIFCTKAFYLEANPLPISPHPCASRAASKETLLGQCHRALASMMTNKDITHILGNIICKAYRWWGAKYPKCIWNADNSIASKGMIQLLSKGFNIYFPSKYRPKSDTDTWTSSQIARDVQTKP